MQGMDFSSRERIRSPVVSGLFYPEEKTAVEAALCSFGLENGIGGNAAAIIAPHGAWKISGATAGAAFTAAAGRAGKQGGPGEITKVVILGTLHNPSEEGLFLSDSLFFETPLGNLLVDQELCEELTSCTTLFEINDIPHLREHTIEVLLPFIKFCFPGAAIIPVLMGGSQPSLISALARALDIVFESLIGEVLFVASANLSHNKDYKTARFQAEECLRLLGGKKSGEFTEAIFNGRISVCGAPTVAALLASGVLEGKAARTGPLKKALGEQGQTVYYGAVSFE
jgi:AmmeMemoRadiSam system protein B